MAIPQQNPPTLLIPIKFNTIQIILCALFFFSGCSTLIYQVTWQRMLFNLFGADLESVTIIVSVFMFGLGAGAIFGGIIADKIHECLLGIFVLCEFAIALFGFASPDIIKEIGSYTVTSSGWVIASVSFAILIIPTMLIGATFPVLVTYINLTEQHIGRSVGILYFANTLGGALGAFFSGFYLLEHIDLTAATAWAAFLNLGIALLAFLIFRRRV